MDWCEAVVVCYVRSKYVYTFVMSDNVDCLRDYNLEIRFVLSVINHILQIIEFYIQRCIYVASFNVLLRNVSVISAICLCAVSWQSISTIRSW